MKHKLTIILLLLINHCFSQTCGNTSQLFFSQSDIDNFVSQYATSGCNTIPGDLSIGGGTDLTGLTFIKKIGGSLNFYNNAPSSIEGLNNIDTITENFLINAAININDLSPSNSIKYIGGYLQIFNATSLTDLNGFNSLVNSGDNSFAAVYISGNPNLVDISGFNGFKKETNSIYINDNELLENISGFMNLTNAGTIQITSNDILENISGFTTLDSLEIIVIDENPLLNNISMFSSIDTVTGGINLRDNPSLNQCCILTKFLTGKSYLGGVFNVSGNDNPCNSANDILANCPDISSCGSVGIGCTNFPPKSMLHIKDGNIYMDDLDSGIILKSPNSNCFFIEVSNNGTLSTTLVDCP